MRIKTDLKTISQKIDPGAIDFTSGFSREKHTVGKQITVEQLIVDQIIMTISKAMIMYIGITFEKSRPMLLMRCVEISSKRRG